VDQPQTRFLRAEECRRLVQAAEPDISRLIRACLFTGMRLGELLSWRVPLNSEGARSFEEAIAARLPQAAVFTQAAGTAWTPMRVSRAVRETCKAAKIDPPIQFRQLRTTYGSVLLNADAPLSTHYAHLLWEKLKETVDERLSTFT
jgi:integrase